MPNSDFMKKNKNKNTQTDFFYISLPSPSIIWNQKRSDLKIGPGDSSDGI